MKTCHWRSVGTTGLGLALAALTGCQTWVGGMTLPSGHYLQHPPQYFPPSPPFPLARELALQQGAAAPVAPVPAVPGLIGEGAPGPMAAPGEVGREVP